MSDAEAPAAEVDCRGLRCPVPVIRLARLLPEVEVGAVVAVTADDPAARPDIAAWCRMRGQEYLGERPAPDGPFGGKGPGEMCANPVLPAMCNAVYDAVGVRIDELPITPEKIPRGIHAIGGARPPGKPGRR